MRSPLLHCTFPASPDSLATLRAAVRDLLAALGVPRRRATDVMLAVGEAAANAAVHAYRDGKSGAYELRADLAGDSLVIEVADHGVGPLPHPEGRGAGIGLAVIAALADGVAFEPSKPGTRLRMTFAGVTDERAGELSTA